MSELENVLSFRKCNLIVRNGNLLTDGLWRAWNRQIKPTAAQTNLLTCSVHCVLQSEIRCTNETHWRFSNSFAAMEHCSRIWRIFQQPSVKFNWDVICCWNFVLPSAEVM